MFGELRLSEIEGFDELMKQLQILPEIAAEGAAEGLVKIGHAVHERSNQLAPEDTGAMKERSGVLVQGTGAETVVQIVYLQYYSIYVHENLEAYHAPPTQAKFLETAVREIAPTMKNTLGYHVELAIRGPVYATRQNVT